jgi:hypothetical protein
MPTAGASTAGTLPLDGDLLRTLGIPADAVERIEPMRGGLSGARLARLWLRYGPPGGPAWHTIRVLKQLTPASSWLTLLAEDTRLREIQLHASHLLDDLPHGIESGALAYAIAGPAATPQAGALLLRDARAHLRPHPVKTPPGRWPPLVPALIERLAALHARYWQDPRLRAPELGLMSPHAALRLLAPDALLNLPAPDTTGVASFYLPLALAGWEAFFALSPAPAARRLRAVLADPGSYTRAVARLPITLLHGDVWGPNLGWLPPTMRAPRRGHRLLLLDWALASAGPVPCDPLWLCGTWHELSPTRVLALYRARLTRHLRARGITLPPATWQALADVGYLRTALTCGEALGRAATEAPAGPARRHAEARVRWWAAHAARAAGRLASRATGPGRA